MPAHMVTVIYCDDYSWIEEYSKHVPAMIEKHGGSYTIVSNGKVDVVEGDWSQPSGVAVFTFPSKQAILEFLNSEEYKPFLELRNRHSRNNILMFDGR